MRRRLKRPLGRLLPNAQVTKEELRARLGQSFTIAVGDATTSTLFSAGITPQVQIVDGKEMRVARALPAAFYRRRFQAENPPGTISRGAVVAVTKALAAEKPARVIIKGEEDLLALVAAALAPEDAWILYGQPKKGLVLLKETSKLRKRVLRLLAEIGLQLAEPQPGVSGLSPSQS